MKKYTTLFIFLSLHLLSHAQGGIWTWVKGDSTLESHGNVGVMGVTNSANFPSARYQGTQWTDLNGNFWIFGGLNDYPFIQYGANSEFNDLWKYDPIANTWTWIRGDTAPNKAGVYGVMGVPSLANEPGARAYGSSAWTDQQGHLWMHGGFGYDKNGTNGALDDMWKYDIDSNQWTWMKGADTVNAAPSYGTRSLLLLENTPGGRAECNTAWVKSNGTLWTFGGVKRGDIGYNDVWEFDIGTNDWAWMNGAQGTDSSYNYGVLNIEDSSNMPPARGSYTHWQDSSDNFYIFGGFNYQFNYAYNDIWKYNTTNNLWTWIGGDSIQNQAGHYILLCSPDTNKLSSRYENRTVQINSNSNILWTFGGCSADNNYVLNDLWYLNLQTGKWTWVSGSDTVNDIGSYGILGTSAVTNRPSARFGMSLWEDNNDVLWMWGGESSYELKFSDMWRFVPDGTCVPITKTTGINSLNHAEGISIYPNPATQSCSIFVSSYNGENYIVRLTDMTGKEISTWSFAGSTNTFSVSEYASGVYLLQISDNNGGHTVRKLVVE